MVQFAMLETVVPAVAIFCVSAVCGCRSGERISTGQCRPRRFGDDQDRLHLLHVRAAEGFRRRRSLGDRAHQGDRQEQAQDRQQELRGRVNPPFAAALIGLIIGAEFDALSYIIPH
jgi:hypothetical protein